MTSKKRIIIPLFSLVAIAVLSGQNIYAAQGSKKIKTNNQVDNGYVAEKGQYFYDDGLQDEQNKTAPEKDDTQYASPSEKAYSSREKAPKGVEALLAELLAESKKQTKLQTQIRDILKEQFAPEPKQVVLQDGTKCIENSSADCFVMPIIPEARRIPVMSAWLANPTDETAKNFLQWEAKWFGQLFDIGSSLQFASARYGSDAYPIGFQRAGFNSSGNVYSVIKEKYDKKLLNSLGKKGVVSLTYYIGKNIDADIFALDNIATLLSVLPDVKIALVFSDNASYQIYNDGSKTFKDFRAALARGNITTRVAPEEFTKLNIKTTPTLYAKYSSPNGNGDEAVLNGKYSSSETIDKVMQVLEYKKVIDRKDRSDEKVWPTSGDYAESYFKDFYGIKLDKEKIRGYYGK